MIAIRNRKMPRYCAECFVDDCPHKSGAAIRLHYRHEYDKPIDCPLVEIGTCNNCSHRDPEDKKCDCGHDIQWQLPREDDWYCKDCTNYVMGALDEEICLRGHELIHKDFYCADYEKLGSET